jgi:hypothetical protein
MLPQKVMINIGVDLFTDANENNQSFLTLGAHHSRHHLLQGSLGEGEMQMLTVTSRVNICSSKNLDLIMLTSLSLLRNFWHLTFLIS